jgi:YD repeat-containing protein
MQRKTLRRFVLPTIAFTSAVALVATVPATASAAAKTGQGGVPLPVSWTPPAQVNRTPTGVPADQLPSRPAAAAPRSGQSPRSVTCATFGGVGLQSWFPMDRYAISDRTELLVNRSSGNAVITDRALTVKGTGLNMSFDAVYNSRTLFGGALGSFWTVSSGPDIYLDFLTGVVIARDATGYCAAYYQNSDGSYATPQGSHATLTKLPDGKYALSQDGSGETWLFTGDGRLSSQTDRNGHPITYRYNPSDASLASITDTQGWRLPPTAGTPAAVS